MKSASASVNRPTTSLTMTPWGSNKTDAVLIGTLTNEYGDTLDCVYPETIKFTCTSDQSTGSSLYSEGFTITGPPQLPYYDQNWPQGSGSSGSITLKDAALNSYIKNGDFADFTVANVPDNWTIRVGTAGTNILQTSTAKRGTSAVEIVSDGSTLGAIKQQLSTSLVKPNQVLIFNAWMKVSTADAAGVVTVKLTDGNGTVLTNDAGTNLSTTYSTNSSIGTSYTNVFASFSTPRQLPSSGVFLDIQLSTSTTAGHNIFIDLVGLEKGQQLYAQGPFVQMFSTAAASAKGDYTSLAVANNAANSSWVRFGQRVLQMPLLGPTFYFPSSGSPTISDALL